jgi:N-acetylglucosamine-6-phosphate deacetylase
MASLNGARFCGIEDRKGKLEEGYDADLLVFDEDINISHVFIEGKKFR